MIIMNIRCLGYKFNIICVIVSAYMIFPFEFRPYANVQSLVVQSILLLYIFVNIPMVFKTLLNRDITLSNILILILIWGGISVGTVLIHSSMDFSYINGPYRNMISWFLHFIVIMIMASKRNKDKSLVESFMILFILSVVLYTIFTCMILVIPGLRNSIYSLINISDSAISNLKYSNFATRIGWAGFTVFDGGLKCALANCFSLFLIFKRIQNRERIDRSMYMYSAFTILGAIFYSRTAVIIIILCLLWFGFSFSSKLHNYQYTIKIFLCLAMVSMVFVLFLSNYSDDNSVLNWMLEMFVSKNSSGRNTSLSLQSLEKMYYLPSPNTLIWGDGRYTGILGGYYGKTDVGFMRYILYFGLSGTIVVYLIVMYALVRLRKLYDKKSGKIILQLFLILIIGFECKGESIQFYFPMIVMLLIIRKYEINYMFDEME